MNTEHARKTHLEEQGHEEDDGDGPRLLRQVPAIHLLPVLRLVVEAHRPVARVEDRGQHLLQRVQQLPRRGTVVWVQLRLQLRQLRGDKVRHVRVHVIGPRHAFVHVGHGWVHAWDEARHEARSSLL